MSVTELMPKTSACAAPTMQTSAEFVRAFIPPDYVVDGILQRGFCYGFTAPTGAGKTAVMLRLMASVALGRTFAGREVERGNVLMLAGENPEDVRARWIALAEQMGFDADEIAVDFRPGIFSLRDDSIARNVMFDWVESVGGVSLVVVDSSAAYFDGDDENSNKQLGDHARVLRSLNQLAGNPCIVVACHPVKNASADNLIPRGGGAFLNEIDGNLCGSKNDSIVEVYWQGKFRGPDFEPLAFELVSVTSAKLVTKNGRLMPTVIARALSETEHSAKVDASHREMYRLLSVMAANEGASIATLADKAGWKVAGDQPHKSKVSRLLKALKRQKLVTKELNTWTLTPSGEKAAKRTAK